MVGAKRKNLLDYRKRRFQFQSLNFTFLVRSFRCIALFPRFLPNLCSTEFAQLFSFKSNYAESMGRDFDIHQGRAGLMN